MNVNCTECGHPAAVLHGESPLCGTCFYKRSVVRAEPDDAGDGNPRSDVMWRRLSDAIASLEAIAAKIAAEMNELVKTRDGDSSEK